MMFHSRIRRDLHIDIRLEQYMLESGVAASVMDKESKLGLTVEDTLESGTLVELMEREDSFILMEMFMMDFG